MLNLIYLIYSNTNYLSRSISLISKKKGIVKSGDNVI